MSCVTIQNICTVIFELLETWGLYSDKVNNGDLGSTNLSVNL